MKSYLPAIIFLLVAGIGIVLVLFWQNNLSARSKAVKRHIADAKALRESDAAGHIRQEESDQPAFIEWLDEKLSGFSSLKLLLIRAGTDKSPAEFMTLSLMLLVGGVLIASLIFKTGIFGSFNIGLISSLLPWWYFSGKAQKRRIKFEDQLPEALDFISRSLRAGHGLTASMGMAGDELEAPIGTELKITFDEINFGIPFKDAMSNFMARIDSPDLNFFTVAVVIQRETGGNLTELLANLSKLIRDRIKLKGKIRVLASEGKFSGILLGGLPFMLSALMTSINPDYMSSLWNTPEGHNLILTGLVMMVLGAFFMSRIVQIKV